MTPLHLLEQARDGLVERIVRKERIFRVCVDVWCGDEEFAVRYEDILDALGRVQDHRSLQCLIRQNVTLTKSR